VEKLVAFARTAKMGNPINLDAPRVPVGGKTAGRNRLGQHYRAVSYRFMITGHVMEEITDHYPEQQVRLNAALADGTLEVVTVSGDAALDLFRILSETGRLGAGVDRVFLPGERDQATDRWVPAGAL
jgi:hypothetical protein